VDGRSIHLIAHAVDVGVVDHFLAAQDTYQGSKCCSVGRPNGGYLPICNELRHLLQLPLKFLDIDHDKLLFTLEFES